MRDLDTIFARLRTSTFRRRFKLGAKESAYLEQRGLQTIVQHAREFVLQRLAPAEPLNDGRQTPMRGHPVFIAQHATATCCRSCLAKWHGIAARKPLTRAEQEHVVAAIARWIESQPKPQAASQEAQASLDLSGDT